MSYATTTTVPVEKSQAEINRLVSRYGATGFGSYTESGRAMIVFQVRARRVMFVLDLPDPADRKFQFTPAHKFRLSPEKSRAAWEQACRSRWRALVLIVKAKLEAIEAGVSTFEDEFLPYFALPDGTRLRDKILPRLDECLTAAPLPPLLPAPGGQS